MHLPRPLVLASGCLKSLLFVAISSDNVPASLTVASVDLVIRGAHLATYAGLGRFGLQLPVGSFLPAPSPMNNTDLALYATPVAATMWDPGARTIDAIVKTVMRFTSSIITDDSTFPHRTIDKLVRLHDHYAGLLVHTQRALSPMSLQELYFESYYNQSSDIRPRPIPTTRSLMLYPLASLPDPFPLATPLSVVERPLSQAPVAHPKLPSVGSWSPTSTAIGLVQCTPYRIFPSPGDAVLATNLEHEPTMEFIHYSSILDEIILDELEESKEPSKLFVIYQPPPCTKHNCALVVYSNPSRVAADTLNIDCVVILLYSHISTAALTIASFFILVYRIARWTVRMLYGIVVCIYDLVGSILISLVRVSRSICDRAVAPSPPVSQEGVSGLQNSPSTPSLPLADLSTSISSWVKSKKKSNNNKKSAGEPECAVVAPALIPLPNDERVWDEDVGDTVEAGGGGIGSGPNQPGDIHNSPSTANLASSMQPLDLELAAPPPVPAFPAIPSDASSSSVVIDPATVPLPASNEGLAVAANVPCAPPSGPSDSALNESDRGGWETVIKRKPWLPFTPAPGLPANPKSQEVRGVKIGRGKWKGRKEV